MARIRLDLTATTKEIDDYADLLGYMPELVTGVKPDNTPIVVPNPKTRKDFLTDLLRESLAETIYKPLVRNIEREERAQRDADKEAKRVEVRTKLVGQFTP